MNTSNINDPVGVAALLEQLKSSAAWQELTAAKASRDATITTPESSSASSVTILQRESNAPNAEFSGNLNGSSMPPNEKSSTDGSSVASLLSQLESFSTEPVESYRVPPPAFNDYGYNYAQGLSVSPSFPSSSYSAQKGASNAPSGDRRNMTFRESLPIISQLADDPSIIATIKKMKKCQDDLERQLYQEREHIYAKYHEKIKVLETKAKLIGAAVSQHEVNMIRDTFKKEMSGFDLERVLPAWDGLISRQQQELAQLSIPTMFITTDPECRKRQQQVIELLFSLLGPKAV